MGIENRAAQAELRKRTTYTTTLPKKELANTVLNTIMEALDGNRGQAREAIIPHPLSSMDEIRVRQLAERRFGNFAYRIGEFTPIRLEESMGMIISIRKKGGRW